MAQNMYVEHLDEAYQLFHRGVLALAEAEEQGLRVDLDYIDNKSKVLTRKIKKLEEIIYESDFFEDWQKYNKSKVNIYSPKQMGAYLYKKLGITVDKKTASGDGSTDEETLAKLGIPELDMFLEIKKIKKLRDTYLAGFLREQVDGFIHPFYNLHLVRTFRSCIAEGTKILTVQDGKENPNGTNIEDVKVGDFVYCFSDDLQPCVRRVLNAGKTGHKKVLRVHWSSNGGGKGFLDVTPEHRIRLINGSYCEAQNLVGDFRTKKDSKHSAKIRTLSCRRSSDALCFTGHLNKNNTGILEHRLVYTELIGDLKEEEIVHHKDNDHYNNRPRNLRKLSKEKHGKLHSKQASEETKQLRVRVLNENRDKIVYKTGKEAHNSLNLTKYQCLRLLAEKRGFTVNVAYDFDTFKKYLKEHGIDYKKIKKRYASDNSYIWRGQVKRFAHLGRTEVSRLVGGCDYHTLIELYNYFGINLKRKWGNQFGEFVPGNHVITKIEYINKYVDVYDLEIEEFNNFFANEICVHNSSDRPNFQNIPKRDKESMNIVRKSLYPRVGHQLMELDYSQLEVRISACYHQDPTMITYIETGHDMHADIAKQVFGLTVYDDSIHSALRGSAKNGFVFAEFYGDYFVNCAKNIAVEWCKLPQTRWKKGQGITVGDEHVSDILLRAGIKEYGEIKRDATGRIKEVTGFLGHLEEIEDDFWDNRFPVYTKWKKTWWEAYQKNGYFVSKTGFLYKGAMSRNDAINYPVQGAAFHVMLWSLIRATETFKQFKMRTRIVGQIHDAIVLDVYPPERDDVISIMQKIMERDVRKAFPWIIVPLHIDCELCPVDTSWADKQKYKI